MGGVVGHTGTPGVLDRVLPHAGRRFLRGSPRSHGLADGAFQIPGEQKVLPATFYQRLGIIGKLVKRSPPYMR